MDHRPRAVVIHRRTKTWIGAAAGVALLAIGWFAGGTLANQRSETASVEVRQDVAGQPAVPPPVPPPVAPATVVIDVPAKTPAGTKHKTVPSSKVLPPVARSTPEPRVDPPAAKPKTVPIGDISNQFADLVKPYLQAKYGPLAASGAER
jgi:hypothetical protein